MKKVIVLLLILAACTAQAQSSLWHPQPWPVLKRYDQQHLTRIALPLGGIGTGTVSLGGRGQLQDWEIMNRPAKGYSTVLTGNTAPFFAIHVLEVKKTKALLGPLESHEYQHMEGRPVDHHGLPRFANASFETAYPFGQVSLSDAAMPVSVRIKGFNPLIPADADASGLPIAVLTYEVTNTGNEPLTVSICGSMHNFIGRDGSKNHKSWKGELEPQGAKQNRNQFRQENGLTGIYMYSDGVDKADPAWGTVALTTAESEGVSYRTSSVTNAWENALLDFWDDFSDDGKLTEKKTPADEDPMASLAVQKKIGPNQTQAFTFFLTWHFPNRFGWSKDRVGNYYTTQYKDAWAVADKTVPLLPKLEQKTMQFVNALVQSSYPDEVKEAALFNTSTLRSQTVFRTEDGRLFGWEGVMDDVGSCQGSCTHVWNYEQATPFLFGNLAKTMRDVEFNYAMDNTGLMSFRVGLPLQKGFGGGVAAADGQMGTIMKFYRDWQLSGDTDFLRKNWPQVKQALAFAWIPGGWDADRDGVMEGAQHNTMDVEYFGPNPQMQLWYLGALKAASAMATAMNDRSFAQTCDQIFQKGSTWTDANLFNGDYYEQQVISPAGHLIAKGTFSGFNKVEQNDPAYQLAKGCLVDQLVGQFMAHVCGLGYLVNPDHVKTTLKSILKYNYRASMTDHFNNMRSYALGDEASLLMASWPKGRPKVPFPYFSEVMTGFEYTAAIGMLYENQTEPGLLCIRNIRNRFDGSKRNPFDEAECGHHYARAMVSWATTLALSGFHYSGVSQIMQFNGQEGTYFWSNGYAWGTCTKTKQADKLQVKLTVLQGQLLLKNLEIGNKRLVARSLKEGESFAGTLSMEK
ncbi:GH116 family glycosyl-hydrolase [Spirosoma sp.]|uniref:GH116 family glycosyl-hydrolase n=1 Tax=Spirosoma sp. TaxID=1899569 RepID=UPI002631FF34|nr:GH116 family glycosyl-hydrolase [Spirosoma sp.]MCX6218918.1 GH116 family glycosyl-hydrolase [Spirosoma sp.]